MNFYFEDFTRNNYRQLLKLAKKQYVFRYYTNFDKNENFILWRHDVDFSMHSARKLAMIEAEEGVKSTYFLHLHSEFYNLLEEPIRECVKSIIQLGHDIGLHFDSHYYNIQTESELPEMLNFEKNIFKVVFNVDVAAFSFHNTTEFTMNCKEWQYAGLINTYAEYFQNNVTYCSDSTGFWRFERLEHILEKQANGPLHILTHPEWWQDEAMSPRNRVQRCAEGRLLSSLKRYDNYLEKKGFLNVS